MTTTIRVSQETYDRLMRVKLANGLDTLDKAVVHILDETDKAAQSAVSY